MGKKSSAKSQTRPSSANSASSPPEEPKRAFWPLLAIARIVGPGAVGVFVATRPAQTPPTAPTSTAIVPAQAPATPVADEPPASVKFGPHTQDRLPPLPFDPTPAAPREGVGAAYRV